MDSVAALRNMNSWIERVGHDRLRSFIADDGRIWIEQNSRKRSPWARLARQGHEVAWEFESSGGYTGRMLIDGEIYTPAEAVRKFLQTNEHRA